MEKKKITINATIIFWVAMLIIGIAALITGSVLKVITGNNLMWLIISFGIILTLVGGILSTYLIIINIKQNHIRSKGI